MHRPFPLWRHQRLTAVDGSSAASSVSVSGSGVHGAVHGHDRGEEEGERGGEEELEPARGVAMTQDGTGLVTATRRRLHVFSLQPSKDEWRWGGQQGGGSASAAFETSLCLHDYCLLEGGGGGEEGRTVRVAVTCKEEPIRVLELPSSSAASGASREMLQLKAEHSRSGETMLSADCLAGYSSCGAMSTLLAAAYNGTSAGSGADMGSSSSARERKGGPISTILLFDLAAGSSSSPAVVARFVSRSSRGATHGQRGRILSVAVSPPFTEESFDLSTGAVVTNSFTRGIVAAGSSDGSLWLYDPRAASSSSSSSCGFASLKGVSKWLRQQQPQPAAVVDAPAAAPASSSSFSSSSFSSSPPLPGITQLTWSSDGLHLFAGYRFTPKHGNGNGNGQQQHPGILCWDLRKRDRPLLGFYGRHSPTAQKIGFSLLPSSQLYGGGGGGLILASGSADGRVLFYDAATGGQPIDVYYNNSDDSSSSSPFFEPFPYPTSSSTSSPASPSAASAINGVCFGFVPSASTVLMALATGQRGRRRAATAAVGHKRKERDEAEAEAKAKAEAKAAGSEEDASPRPSSPPSLAVFGWASAAPSTAAAAADDS